MKQVVLDDLRRVTHFARLKERQFAAYINQKNSLELRREINTLQMDVDAFIEKAKRYATIDVLTPELLRLFIQRIEIGERSKKAFALLRAEHPHHLP